MWSAGSVVVEGGATEERDYQTLFKQKAQRCSGGQLNLWNVGIDDHGAKQIASALILDSAVKLLYLSVNAIGDAGAEALGDALRVNNTLRGLTLARNKVGPAGFAYLAETLADLDGTMQFFGLRMNPVFSVEASCVDERRVVRNSLGKLISTSKLRGLSLGKTGLADMECEVIGEALASARCSISILCLGENTISDEGVAMLCSGLEMNASVKNLDLSNNRISDAGARRIGQCLDLRAEQGVPLQHVWMEGNPAEPEAYTDCMVNSSLYIWSIADVMNAYL